MLGNDNTQFPHYVYAILTQHLYLDIATRRLLLLILRHARVRARILQPLKLLDD